MSEDESIKKLSKMDILTVKIDNLQDKMEDLTIHITNITDTLSKVMKNMSEAQKDLEKLEPVSNGWFW